MNDALDIIFQREIGRLYSEWERCNDAELKEEIKKDIMLLKEAIKIILSDQNAT